MGLQDEAGSIVIQDIKAMRNYHRHYGTQYGA